jgi:hypothetical protein
MAWDGSFLYCAWYLIYSASSLIFQAFVFERFQEKTTDRPANELARLCHVECSAGVLQGTAPPCMLELALLDYNQTFFST